MGNSLENLIERLPSYFERSENSSNYSLLNLGGEELDELKQTAEELANVIVIDKTEGYNLDRIGENIQQRRGYLKDRIYKILLKARIKINISSGTINEIIEILSTIFETDPSEIEVEEPFWGTFKFSSKDNEPEYNNDYGFDSGKLATNPQDCAHFKLYLPPKALNSVGFSRQWFEELVKEISAAGVSIELALKGTFSFASENDTPDYDNDYGFDSGTLGAYFEPAAAKNLPLERS